MKKGKTLVELATELQRQSQPGVKTDYIIPAKELTVTEDRQLAIPSIGTVDINEVAHGQFASYLKIPKQYYDRLREEGNGLFAKNVNHWLSKSDDKRMVRRMDNTARAFLSDKFNIDMDYTDIATALLPVLGEMNLEVVSSDITERKFYLKAVDRSIFADIPTGKKLGNGHTFFDTLSPAINISTSEVGFGATAVQAGTLTAMCTNLAWIMDNRTMRKYHVGARHEIVDNHYELLSDETRQQSKEVFLKQLIDIVRSAFDKARFEEHINKLKGLVEQKIENPIKVVERTVKQFDMLQSEKENILKHLIEGGDLTRYGLYNAVTRTAEDLADYDRASEFEKFGGQIVELPQSDWKILNAA